MSAIRIVKDLDECAFLWQSYYPIESLFDLWQIRENFSQLYGRENCFIVHEDSGRLNGLLPLCKIIENHQVNENCNFAFFPGEIWKKRTWMEQNKIVAQNSHIMNEMLCSVPGSADIRYLSEKYLKNIPSKFTSRCTVDETGYLFYPEYHEYSYENYLGAFAGKSRKKILSEVRAIEKADLSFRYNKLEDLDYLFELNISNFGEDGYFHDPRFLNAFIQLARYLNEQRMLRVVTVLVDGQIAAVDMGAMWNNSCTMLAGGTSKNFPGIAKLINLHHMEWACSQKVASLDFLCGDFGWKGRFHLTPRPLYQINIDSDC